LQRQAAIACVRDFKIQTYVIPIGNTATTCHEPTP